jgi:carbamoyltransferase
VLREDVSDWFEMDVDSPYMLLIADVVEAHRSDIPAVTHVDRSARVQTVHRETNPRFHALLGAFKRETGCPVLVNTSFNVRGEPIVCTPEDAFRCFMGTGIEALAVGDCFLLKAEQDPALAVDYAGTFEPD